MDYSGKVITKNPVTPTRSSAPGVWTVQDAAAAVEANNWPVAGVPNPILRSLRFNSADSTYLNRTPTSTGDTQKYTLSFWAKRGSLGSIQKILTAANASSAADQINFNSTNTIRLIYGDGVSGDLATVAVFRDTSAWYHVVVSIDTTQATSTNRCRVYVNGVEQTLSGSYPAQNYNSGINRATLHVIGARYSPIRNNYNGYLTEMHMIDGQALTPSSFGLTDPATGQWVPKAYSGAYGTNGFYLTFQDNSSTGALGTDYSGNNNTWGVNNFSVTAGSGNDSLVDVPTPWIAYNTTGDVGGVVRGNYATLNPLQTGIDLSNGNLNFTNGAANESSYSTIGVSSGKWFCEAVFTSYTSTSILGIAREGSTTTSSYIGSNSGSYGWDANGNKYNNGSGTAYGSARSANDVIG